MQIQARPSRRSIQTATSLFLLGCICYLVWPWSAVQPTPAQSSNDNNTPSDQVWVRVLAAADADLSGFFAASPYQQQVDELQRLSGYVPANQLDLLAQHPAVVTLQDGTQPALVPPELPDQTNVVGAVPPPAPGSSGTTETIETTSDWYQRDTQGAREVWNTFNITGTGTTVAIIDSGVDFANPALQGRYAVQPATSSGVQAYAGWPIAFDDLSLNTYLSQPNRPVDGTINNWNWYVNANRPISAGTNPFTDTIRNRSYTLPGTSQSGTYWLGYHPDSRLQGGQALVLVADETTAGVYHAVYLDLDDNGTFETRLDQHNPVAALDTNTDNVADVSGGMLYWISDGVNPPPGAAAIYGSGLPVAPAGQLLAFMIDTSGHGTRCASNMGGNDGGAFTPDGRIPTFYNFATHGPLVQGPAPGAKIIAMGNVYNSNVSMEATYLFTVLGYDGVPNSGDEPDIASLSFGNGLVDNDVWDWSSRYLSYLNYFYDQTYGPGSSPLYVTSAGNGGYGYGTVISPNPITGLAVGAATQYGSHNWIGNNEHLTSAARISSGDSDSFSGRGPGADGTRPIDLLAGGHSTMAGAPLNSKTSGANSYDVWWGTSVSAPVVAGTAALVFEAFVQKYGRVPSYAELRTLLMNGARDRANDPMTQGAGLVDAFRSVQLALQTYGVQIEPPALVAGTLRGTTYPSAARGLRRGESQTLALTLTNQAALPTDISVTTGQLLETAAYSSSLTSLPFRNPSNYNSGAPDYAVDLTPWINQHPNADLMVARLTLQPNYFFDTTSGVSTRNAWNFLLYNWWDDNNNNTWWTDLNDDGRVDLTPSELDAGDDWVRLDFTSRRGQGSQDEIRITAPYERIQSTGSKGIWAGLAHISSTDTSTGTLRLDVRFYEYQTWSANLVQVSPTTRTLPAGGTTNIQVSINVPATARYGLHQGAVIVTTPGNTNSNPQQRPQRSIIPLTFQVWPELSNQQPTVLGTEPDAGVLGEPAGIGGGFSRNPRESEMSDWRFYTFDLQPPAGQSALLMTNQWEAPLTDIDTQLLGPAVDQFSALYPNWFGPATANVLARTPNNRDLFDTSTGTTAERLAIAARDGVHVLVHRAILYGDQALRNTTPYTTQLGLATLTPAQLYVDPNCALPCTVTAEFRAGLDLPGGLASSIQVGWATPTRYLQQTLAPGATNIYPLTLDSTTNLIDVRLTNLQGTSAPILLLYDDNGGTPGSWDTGDTLLQFAPGETIVQWRLNNPAAGTYWLRVTTAQPEATSVSYDLTATIFTATNNGLQFTSLPSQIVAGQTYSLTLTVDQPVVAGQQSLLVLGPTWQPDVLALPVLAATPPPPTPTPTATPTPTTQPGGAPSPTPTATPTATPLPTATTEPSNIFKQIWLPFISF